MAGSAHGVVPGFAHIPLPRQTAGTDRGLLTQARGAGSALATVIIQSVFALGRDIVNHCRDVWNKLLGQPWTIMSIRLHDWVHACASVGAGIMMRQL